jgi:hypothetical protein
VLTSSPFPKNIYALATSEHNSVAFSWLGNFNQLPNNTSNLNDQLTDLYEKSCFSA